jgi:small nuclear ribonucleoprotein (snRNP)-like protein
MNVDVKTKNHQNGRVLLSKWLNSNMRVKITDGRILIGLFLCTDRDQNIILGQCQEYINSTTGNINVYLGLKRF